MSQWCIQRGPSGPLTSPEAETRERSRASLSESRRDRKTLDLDRVEAPCSLIYTPSPYSPGSGFFPSSGSPESSLRLLLRHDFVRKMCRIHFASLKRLMTISRLHPPVTKPLSLRVPDMVPSWLTSNTSPRTDAVQLHQQLLHAPSDA